MCYVFTGDAVAAGSTADETAIIVKKIDGQTVQFRFGHIGDIFHGGHFFDAVIEIDNLFAGKSVGQTQHG